MRTGRVRVTSEGAFHNTHVEVVPDDGGEPIALPCTTVNVDIRPGDFVRVSLETVRGTAELLGELDDKTAARLAQMLDSRPHDFADPETAG